MIKSDLARLFTEKTDPDLPFPLFKSISEMARLAIAHSDDLEANKLASIKTQISQALRVNDPKPLSDDLVDGILSATEAVLKEEGKARHARRVKRNIQGAFERLESRDLHPVTSNKEDMLVKAVVSDLAQSKEIVFSRWDKVHPSKAKTAIDQYLAEWLVSSDEGPKLIFVVTHFYDGFRQLKDLLALLPVENSGESHEILKSLCRTQKLKFWIASLSTHFFPLAMIDPARSEERAYFFLKGDQSTCVPLNIAASDVRDWSNGVYMPMLEADECLDNDRAFGLLVSSNCKRFPRQPEKTDTFSALDIMAHQTTIPKQTEKTDTSSALDIMAEAQLG